MVSAIRGLAPWAAGGQEQWEAAVWWCAIAWAQDGGIDAHGFVPAVMEPDRADPILVVRPDSAEGGDLAVGVMFEYANAPLVVHEDPEFGSDIERVVLGNFTALDLSVSAVPHERLRVDAVLPVILVSTNGKGAALPPALADLRARLVGLIFEGGVGEPNLAAVGWADLPTGESFRWLGRTAVGGGGGLAATWSDDVVVLTGETGLQFDPKSTATNLAGDDAWVSGFAVGFLPEPNVGVSLEARIAVPFLGNQVARAATPAEGLVSARFRTSAGMVVAGLGAGLLPGAGASPIRVFFGGAVGRVAEEERDVDAVTDLRVADRCPTQVETINGWMDDDGCPDVLGRLHLGATWRNEPRSATVTAVDNTGTRRLSMPIDGLDLDVAPGTAVHLDFDAGCLVGQLDVVALEGTRDTTVPLALKGDARVLVEVVDSLGRPVSGAHVRWASQTDCVPSGEMDVALDGTLTVDVGAGSHTVLVDATGAGVGTAEVEAIAGMRVSVRVVLTPSRVVVEGDQLRLDEKVFFEPGRSVIRPVSFDLLDAVAVAILANPAVGRVVVGGHTDGSGDAEVNSRLSLQRAQSVVVYLVRRGVPAARLEARGFGETVPIASEESAAGREANRRVEFRLMDPGGPG